MILIIIIIRQRDTDTIIIIIIIIIPVNIMNMITRWRQCRAAMQPQSSNSRCCPCMKKGNNTELLASRVSSKLEEGNYKGAVRLVSSEDGFAEHSTVTLEALKTKHPSPSSDSFIPALDPATPLPLAVDIATILKVI